MERLTPLGPPGGERPPEDQVENLTASPADGYLLARALNGDLDAFNEFVERYQHAVVSLCTSILRDASLAEDVAQDTFIRAWKNLPGFKGESAKSWLLRIATNRCLDLIRQRSRQATDSLDAQVVESEPLWSTQTRDDSPEAAAELGELSDRLDTALAELPADQRIALLMSDVLGYDYLDVAELTGTGQASGRAARGRRRAGTFRTICSSIT
jgi:RNA polymerase sigma-70 factor (ECF subfamily)